MNTKIINIISMINHIANVIRCYSTKIVVDTGIYYQRFGQYDITKRKGFRCYKSLHTKYGKMINKRIPRRY